MKRRPPTAISFAPTSGARVDEALAALPERQRLALVLVHFEGCEQKIAAAAMDVSIDALESLLSRARRGLKAAFSERLAVGACGYRAAVAGEDWRGQPLERRRGHEHRAAAPGAGSLRRRSGALARGGARGPATAPFRWRSGHGRRRQGRPGTRCDPCRRDCAGPRCRGLPRPIPGAPAGRDGKSSSPPLDFDRYRRQQGCPRRGGACHGRRSAPLRRPLRRASMSGQAVWRTSSFPPLLVSEVSEEELWSPAIVGDAAALVEDDE